MGHRTVVILSNDATGTWRDDPELGAKIHRASQIDVDHYFEYGSIGEMVHCDTQTIVAIDSLHMTELAHSHFDRNETRDDANLKLLRLAAGKLGYRLVLNS